MDQRNLILAIVVSVAIVLGYQFLIEGPKLERQRAAHPPQAPGTTETMKPPATTPDAAPVPAAEKPAPASEAQTAPANEKEILAQSPRIAIATPRLTGSIALKGGRLDDLTLTEYRADVSPDSAPITLLTPPGTADAYYAVWGWSSSDSHTKLPDAGTEWHADGAKLTPASPVTLTWDNGEGLKFSCKISVDDAYMFTIQQRVENSGTAAVQLFPYTSVWRFGNPPVSGYYLLHEGPIGVLGGALHDGSWLDSAKINYKDLKKPNQPDSYKQPTTGGWLGFTDKYWLVAAIPDQHAEVQGQFSNDPVGGQNRYQADFIAAHGLAVEPGKSAETSSMLFAGAKEVARLNSYEDGLGISRLSYAVDWGWFFFLTKPIFWFLDILYHQVGNFGIAIILLTVCIKGLFFPLANRSYRSMSKLKTLQPEMMKIRERFGDDRERMNKEMMELYRREKANPVSGCLPMIVQIPVFFALYKVLFVTIEMRHAPFYGWIHDLSSPDPTTWLNLFGLIPWTPPHFLDIVSIGAWPLVMGLTMFLQQRLTPQPADPIQARMFLILPVVFTFMLAHFPSGLVIYWAWNNSLTILQQWTIMRRARPASARATAPPQ